MNNEDNIRVLSHNNGAYLLGRLGGAKEDGDESQPHDAGGVHGEADGFGFVERLRNASCLYGVHRTRHHQQHAVPKGLIIIITTPPTPPPRGVTPNSGPWVQGFTVGPKNVNY